MEIFDSIKEIFNNLFNIYGDGWVIRKNISTKNIENCNGIATSDESTNSCALCVALNDTVFKSNNKPLYYHVYCKCRNLSYNLQNVVLDFPMKKITEYLFVNPSKKMLMESMAYTIEDAQEIYDKISNYTKQQFLLGNYTLEDLGVNGQKLNIVINLYGRNEKFNKVYNFYTGWMAYPNGKLHNNTPFGGWAD
ncbi:MAG: hypothetical protein WC942_08480 [Clostridia bacterium]|jgi:hypothetical protein|nr:hypothetical protein [Clostridia bacterium]